MIVDGGGTIGHFDVMRKNLSLLRRRPVALALLGASLLSGCTPLKVLDILVPAGEYNLTPDVAYGDLPRQRLDIYRPADADPSSPVIVFFYGGSWKSGERRHYRFVGEALTRKGYTVVIPDYRLHPDVTFPAFMTDAAHAVRWARDNLRGNNGKNRDLYLAGHSAGAHIAALLTVDTRYLNDTGLSTEIICGVIGLAGPYAFDPNRYRSTRAVFGGLENTDIARPIKQIYGRTPPFMLIHGDADTTVRASNTTQFAATLREAGTTVTMRLLPAIGHSKILLSISEPFDDIAPVNDMIAEFVDSRTGCK